MQQQTSGTKHKHNSENVIKVTETESTIPIVFLTLSVLKLLNSKSLKAKTDF